MTWVSDFYDGTYGTKTTNIGPSWIYYDRKFLETVKNKLRMVNLGQVRPLPEGNGKIIEFFRYLNLAAATTALSEGVHPNATLFKMQDLQATIKEYGAWVQITSLLKSASIDQKMDGIIDILAEQGATTLDQICHREVASNGGYLLRADMAAASTFTGTITTATSTTSFADSALETNTDYGDANDDLNQSVITMLTGTSYGQARTVTDYVASGGVLTTPAFDVAPAVGDTYRVTSMDAVASGDDLSYANLKRAVALLRHYKAMPGEDGFFTCVVDPFQIENLMDDTVWKNVNIYKDQTQGIFKGEIGKFASIRFIEETNQFSCPIETIGTAGTAGGPGAAGANYSAAGEVTLVPIMGRNAYGVTNFSKDGNVSDPTVIIKTPNKNSTDQPLNRFSTAGWVVPAVYKALNPLHLINIACYNSSLSA